MHFSVIYWTCLEDLKYFIQQSLFIVILVWVKKLFFLILFMHEKIIYVADIFKAFFQCERQ